MSIYSLWKFWQLACLQVGTNKTAQNKLFKLFSLERTGWHQDNLSPSCYLFPTLIFFLEKFSRVTWNWRWSYSFFLSFNPFFERGLWLFQERNLDTCLLFLMHLKWRTLLKLQKQLLLNLSILTLTTLGQTLKRLKMLVLSLE